MEGIPSGAGEEEEEIVVEAEDDVKTVLVQATEVESQGVKILKEESDEVSEEESEGGERGFVVFR